MGQVVSKEKSFENVDDGRRMDDGGYRSISFPSLPKCCANSYKRQAKIAADDTFSCFFSFDEEYKA